MDNNEVIVKQKSNKGLIVVIIILIIMVLGLCGYIVYDKYITKEEPKTNEITTTDTIKTDTTEVNNTTNTIDKEQVLREITKVYEEAFDEFSKGTLDDENKDLEYYKNKYGNHFTVDGAYRVFQMQNDTCSGILSTIFNITDQGKRTLTLMYANDTIAIATGVFEPDGSVDWGDKTPYPEYITFKKVDGVWKIDMFE